MLKINKLLSIAVIYVIYFGNVVYGTSFFLFDNEGRQYEYVTNIFTEIEYYREREEFVVSNDNKGFRRIIPLQDLNHFKDTFSNKVISESLAETNGLGIVRIHDKVLIQLIGEDGKITEGKIVPKIDEYKGQFFNIDRTKIMNGIITVGHFREEGYVPVELSKGFHYIIEDGIDLFFGISEKYSTKDEIEEIKVCDKNTIVLFKHNFGVSFIEQFVRIPDLFNNTNFSFEPYEMKTINFRTDGENPLFEILYNREGLSDTIRYYNLDPTDWIGINYNRINIALNFGSLNYGRLATDSDSVYKQLIELGCVEYSESVQTRMESQVLFGEIMNEFIDFQKNHIIAMNTNKNPKKWFDGKGFKAFHAEAFNSLIALDIAMKNPIMFETFRFLRVLFDIDTTEEMLPEIYTDQESFLNFYGLTTIRGLEEEGQLRYTGNVLGHDFITSVIPVLFYNYDYNYLMDYHVIAIAAMIKEESIVDNKFIVSLDSNGPGVLGSNPSKEGAYGLGELINNLIPLNSDVVCRQKGGTCLYNAFSISLSATLNPSIFSKLISEIAQNQFTWTRISFRLMQLSMIGKVAEEYYGKSALETIPNVIDEESALFTLRPVFNIFQSRGVKFLENSLEEMEWQNRLKMMNVFNKKILKL